jgi:hypothetical protein
MDDTQPHPIEGEIEGASVALSRSTCEMQTARRQEKYPITTSSSSSAAALIGSNHALLTKREGLSSATNPETSTIS